MSNDYTDEHDNAITFEVLVGKRESGAAVVSMINTYLRQLVFSFGDPVSVAASTSVAGIRKAGDPLLRFSFER
jgi:hypothetical protein